MTSRAYLAATDRRRQLLDAAARCFAREGYVGLTMVAVAAEAGVSRRLVYNHFPDQATLSEAYLDDRARRYLGAIDAAVGRGGGDRRAAFDGAFRHLLSMPADDQRAIRLLVTDPGLPELERLRTRLRDHIEARWLPAFTDTVPDADLARGLLWAVVSSLLGLADLVARDELTEDQAMHLAGAVLAAVPAVLAPVP